MFSILKRILPSDILPPIASKLGLAGMEMGSNLKWFGTDLRCQLTGQLWVLGGKKTQQE